MLESEPSSAPTSIYGFFQALKLTHGAEPAGSAGDQDPGVRTPAEAWTVRVDVLYRSRTTIRGHRETDIVCVKTIQRATKTYVVYLAAMRKLLNWPKPAFDQLALELPTLMGFRPEEVGTWRAEYIFWQSGDALVLDAKQHKLYLVPMHADVERHADEVLDGRSSGYVLNSRSNAWQRHDKPISPTAVWYIWDKWIRRSRIPRALRISPIVGRRVFAFTWRYLLGLPLETLQVVMRHAEARTTEEYVASLIAYEDVKRDYDRYQAGLRRETAPEVRA